MMYRSCDSWFPGPLSIQRGAPPSCDKTQMSNDRCASSPENYQPCCIRRNWTKAKQNGFLFPPTPTPQQQNIFCYFQCHKRHKQVARRHREVSPTECSLWPWWVISSIQVMTVGPLRPVLSWIWDIFSAMAMRGLSTAWKKRRNICEQHESAAGQALWWVLQATSGFLLRLPLTGSHGGKSSCPL